MSALENGHAPQVDERISALALQVGRANARVERLEDELGQAQTDVRSARAGERLARGEASARRTSPLQRLALNKMEAAEMLGVSVDFFDDHISYELKCVRRGRRRLYPVRELERWLGQEAEAVGPRSRW
jgi:hypothetical protein